MIPTNDNTPRADALQEQDRKVLQFMLDELPDDETIFTHERGALRRALASLAPKPEAADGAVTDAIKSELLACYMAGELGKRYAVTDAANRIAALASRAPRHNGGAVDACNCPAHGRPGRAHAPNCPMRAPSPAREAATAEWVLVPREPTHAMLDAGVVARQRGGLFGAWAEMLHTAPTAPDATGGQHG